MVTGQTGVPGEHAQSPVVAEVRCKLEVAIILHRHMVDWFASETATNRENATLTHAEVGVFLYLYQISFRHGQLALTKTNRCRSFDNHRGSRFESLSESYVPSKITNQTFN